MRLKNKRTGEVKDWDFGSWYQIILNPDNKESYECTLTDFMNRTAKFREEWEDAPEEPKEFYFIDQFMSVSKGVVDDVEYAGRHKAVNYAKETSNNLKTAGNYFETKEEAELAVRKLKAWKRLKDKGFRFEGIKQDYTRFFSQQKPMRIGRKYLQFNKAEDEEWLKENWEDLGLLFSQEDAKNENNSRI